MVYERKYWEQYLFHQRDRRILFITKEAIQQRLVDACTHTFSYITLLRNFEICSNIRDKDSIEHRVPTRIIKLQKFVGFDPKEKVDVKVPS